jgi:hypothetical protein
MQESSYQNRTQPRPLPEDAPNILIILIDDAGPGLPDTFGGEVRTDTLSRIRDEGIGFNRFHTTAMCSPTRASLMTGRNHHRIGNGQIAELANDWDGYAGEIPKSSALGAEVLKQYGYSTAAFGEWHNTPAIETTAAGPFHNWPSEIGFEYSYEYAERKPGGPLNVAISVGDDQVAAGTVPVSAPLLFTANDCLDIGTCLGGPVSLDYYDRAPFPFTGTINNVNVRYTS